VLTGPHKGTNGKKIDDDDIFGKMIASKCRNIKNVRVKRTLQKKINDLMFEAEEKMKQ